MCVCVCVCVCVLHIMIIFYYMCTWYDHYKDLRNQFLVIIILLSCQAYEHLQENLKKRIFLHIICIQM